MDYSIYGQASIYQHYNHFQIIVSVQMYMYIDLQDKKISGTQAALERGHLCPRAQNPVGIH